MKKFSPDSELHRKILYRICLENAADNGTDHNVSGKRQLEFAEGMQEIATALGVKLQGRGRSQKTEG